MAGLLVQPFRSPAAATRAALPFSLLTQQPSLPTVSIPRLRQLPAPTPRRAFSASVSRHARPRRSGEKSPSVTMAQMQNVRPSAMVNFRVPQTFVPPKMMPYLKEPRVFLSFGWQLVKTRAVDRFAELVFWFKSKPSFLGRAQFKSNRRALAPMAKEMHYQMLEAVAAGDLKALRPLLTNSHFDEVAGLLTRRARGLTCNWELLAYHGRPKLVSLKSLVTPGATSMYVRQAVVSIRSRQRFTWTHAAPNSHTAPKPPKVVEKDVKENVVLVAVLNPNTWETEDWRIFGFMEDTTPESWARESKLVQDASKRGITDVAKSQAR